MLRLHNRAHPSRCFGISLILIRHMIFIPAISTFSVPIEFWVGGLVALSAGTILGFLTGYYLGRDSTKRRIKQAGKEVTRLVETIVDILETAHSACARLESLTGLKLTTTQHQQLESKQSKLFQSFRNIFSKTVDKKKALAEAIEVAPKKEKKEKPTPLEWENSPLNNVTKLPNREAFDTNLSRLLENCQTTNGEAGVLFIQVDKFSHLESRFGQAGALKFFQSMASLIIKAMRNEDLLCQYNKETFALLIPAVNIEDGQKLAQAIRSAIRHRHFRLEANAPEVLVTASFGYTQCTTSDIAELVTSRASKGLQHSQRRGRNQLHVSTENELIHCTKL